MGWQTEVAIQLQAGNTIINQSGTFVYSGPPAAGNLIFSAAPAAGTDQFGNAYLEGATTYIVSGGSTFAFQMGGQGGATGFAFFVHNQTNPPSADPGYSANLASPAGTAFEIVSGKATAGSTQALIIGSDSTQSGIANGEIDLLAGAITLGTHAVSTIPVAGVSGSIATLPNDNNSGSTWVAGERAFMNNNWVANINSNFSTIITALQSAGIIS